LELKNVVVLAQPLFRKDRVIVLLVVQVVCGL
jgi:hypothetical protein